MPGSQVVDVVHFWPSRAYKGLGVAEGVFGIGDGVGDGDGTELFDGVGIGDGDIEGEGFVDAGDDGFGLLAAGEIFGIATDCSRGVTHLPFRTAMQGTTSFTAVGLMPTARYDV